MFEPEDRVWGTPMINGTWKGIVGTLQRQEADFSLNLTPTAGRMDVISFSTPYTKDSLLILSLKPEPLPQHLALMRPFTGRWKASVLTSGGSCILLFSILKKKKKFNKAIQHCVGTRRYIYWF